MLQEIKRLLDNCEDTQLEVVAGVVSRMAAISSEKWTGKINFELNINHGSICDMHVNRGEIVRFKKKRRVRSQGIQ